MDSVNNPCVRCGKERIVKKTWKEHVGTALTTYELTVCPDTQCQKVVDQKNALEKEKKERLMNRKLGGNHKGIVLR